MNNYFFRFHKFIDKHNGNGLFSDITDIVLTFFIVGKLASMSVNTFIADIFNC